MKLVKNKYLDSHSFMFRKEFLLSLLFFIVVGSSATFLFYNSAIDISTKIPVKKQEAESLLEKQKLVVYVGVISRYPPNIIFKGYQPIIDYLNQNEKYHFELKLSTSYNETVNQLIKGEVAVAFFGTFLYINAHERYGIIPILKPLNEDFKPFFRSVAFVKSESSINSIKDLRGKRIALPSEESFSGNWLIKYELLKYNTQEKDIKEIKNFAYHQNVVYQVLSGSFDAGVVKDRVIREYRDKGIKIIGFSEPVPGSPIVSVKDYDEEIINTIKSQLLKINLNEAKYKELVKSWDSEFTFGFVEAKDSDYDLIRKYSGQ
ncbi:MAG: PhnD/SsuA/transferrin family substrate-binding protein [Ignavibacteriaceae bacterium]